MKTRSRQTTPLISSLSEAAMAEAYQLEQCRQLIESTGLYRKVIRGGREVYVRKTPRKKTA